ETVLRGGFGVYYDQGSAGATNGFPLSATSDFLTGVSYPFSPADLARLYPTIVIPTTVPVKNSIVYANDPNLQLPYTLQWNVALERAFGTRQTMSVAYVGAAGRGLLTEQSLNLPPGFSSGSRPNPNFNNIQYMWNGASSDYNAMQLQYS